MPAVILGATIATVEAQPYPTAVLADHPTAYWRLQETTGTNALDSAGSDNGYYTNVVLGQQGFTNSNPAELAAEFGPSTGFSTDSYVGGMTLDEASSANTAFSAEAWINGGGPPSAGIVGKGWGGGGEEFYLDLGGSGGQYRFFVRNAAGTAYTAVSTVLPDSNWHHIVGVCDEIHGSIYLYLDSLLIASNSASGGIFTTTNPYVTIGCRQSSHADYNDQFAGDISDVAIYPYALTPAQVQAHYLAAGIVPTITEEPTNSLTVDAGSTVIIPAAASGTAPLSYQWTTNGVAMAGQTNATFDVTNISFALNGATLILNVTNAYGLAQSTGTTLFVNIGPPQILTDVGPPLLLLYNGESKTYSVDVEGNEPFYYQWLENGSAISGATNSFYTAIASGSNTYQVYITNDYNGVSVQPSQIAALVGIAAPTSPYPAKILSDDPVAYWRLDETNGATIANDYVGGHDGNYSQVVLGVPGYSSVDTDTAVEVGTNAGFSTDSYMQEIDNSAQGLPLIDFAGQGSNADFSVEVWAKGPPGQNPAGSCIVAKGYSGSDQFTVDASAPGGKFRFNLRNAKGGSAGAIYSPVGPDGNWHHLVAVCDETDGEMVLYVDGQTSGTITAIGGTGVAETPVPVSVGAQSSGGDFLYQFNGTIDEVSLYNYALSAGEVAAHYQAAPQAPYFTSQPPTNVVSYAGGSVTLSASVLGSQPITNQWYIGDNSLLNQTNLALVLTNLAGGTNTYVLKVSNAYGSTNTAGTTVQVPVGSGPPAIVTDLKPLAASFYEGESVTYSVTASGSAPLSYQWWSNGVAVPSATSSSYALTNLTANDAGSYYVVVSNSISTIDSSTAVLGVVPPPTNPYSLTVIADHPVAYYRMDETNGSTIGYDYVGGNNGIYSNTSEIFHVPGAFGSLYDADTAAYFGSNNVSDTFLGTIPNVDFAVPNGQNGAFSVEAWVEGPTTVNQTSGGGIVGKGVGNADEQFALDAHTGFRFYVRNQATATSVAGAQGALTLGGIATGWKMDGNWHHLVGVCDQANSNILLYVDGTLIGPNIITNGVVPPLAYAYDINHAASVSTTGTNGVIYPLTGIHEPTDVGSAFWYANLVSIGARNRGSGNPGENLDFVGAVDEVALYNYPLSPLQVSNHYAVA
ncbi:MAG TPA: LamG-like jellyroll fold domain-containing protein, partial [Verrucomicrobiae bacterium]|nr:LamG-like jellyroll fold domain-containing protein [Verrucomicrobiae bacterium]